MEINQWMTVILSLITAIFCMVSAEEITAENEDMVKKYLKTYGYMSDKGNVGSLTQAGSPMLEGLKEFQMMAGLPPTGRLDAETLSMMNKPRCGFPDHVPKSHMKMRRRRKRYTLLRSSWTMRMIQNLRYRLGQIPPNLNREQLRAAIAYAFEMWREHIPAFFSEIQPGQGVAEIEIAFQRRNHGDGFSFDGPGGTLAHAFSPGPFVQGDVHMDLDETWVFRSPRENDVRAGTDVFVVILHELGHALGLGHTDVTNSIMQPFYNPRQRVLGKDDIDGIQYIYGAVKKPVPSPAPPPDPMTPRPTVTPRPRPDPSTALPPRPDPGPDRTPFPPRPAYCGRDAPKFSAVVTDAYLRTYAFSGPFVYQLQPSGVVDGYPKLILEVFEYFYSSVDAAFRMVRSSDNREVIYLMKGNTVATYDARSLTLLSGRVQAIDEVFEGLPTPIDDIFVWSRNNRVYAFKGNLYYRLDHARRQVDRGYPMPITRWDRSFTKVDAVFTWPANRRTYFFINSQYVRFDDNRLQVDQNSMGRPYPRRIDAWWLACPDDLEQEDGGSHGMEGQDMDTDKIDRVDGKGTVMHGWGLPSSDDANGTTRLSIAWSVFISSLCMVYVHHSFS